MAKIASKINTNVAYGVGPNRIELKRGENDVPDAAAAALQDTTNGDKHFQKAIADGWLSIVADDAKVDEGPNSHPAQNNNNTAPAKAGEAPASDPRVKLPKESDKAYKARMSQLDLEAGKGALDADQKTFVADFYGMTAEEQAATYPTLTDDEKALVDANKPKAT